MNKFAIPSLLMGAIFVAGIAAFLPVDDAQAVHTTINTETDRARMAVSTTLTEATTISIDKGFILIDVHSEIDDGYITLATNSANAIPTNAANMFCGTWTAAGAEVGTATQLAIIGGELTDTARNVYHCHIPQVSTSILVGLTNDGTAPVLPIDSIITVVIDKLV